MTSKAKILIVDDDRDEVDIALRALRRGGLGESVEVVRDGQEALEVLGLEASVEQVSRIRPRVIFLDLKMPRVDGWEVLRRIRKSADVADLPVVILSSSDQDSDVQRCYALGANSFLVKRFDPKSPGAYLVDAARYWLDLNQAPPRGRES
jgi:CheY-like chemotaxis protein